MTMRKVVVKETQMSDYQTEKTNQHVSLSIFYMHWFSVGALLTCGRGLGGLVRMPPMYTT